MKWITMIGIGLGIVWLWGSISSSQRDIVQAQAVIESAKAAQEAARAANTAATGLSIMGSGQTLILLLLTAALVGTWALVVYLILQRSCSLQRGPRGERSGEPSASRRAGHGGRLLLPDRTDGGDLVRGADLGALIQLEVLQTLRSLRQAPEERSQILAQAEEEDELW